MAVPQNDGHFRRTTDRASAELDVAGICLCTWGDATPLFHVFDSDLLDIWKHPSVP